MSRIASDTPSKARSKGRAWLSGTGGGQIGPRGAQPLLEQDEGLVPPDRFGGDVARVEHVVAGRVHRAGDLPELGVPGQSVGPLLVDVDGLGVYVHHLMVKKEAA
jgi:hypothetical protein